MYNPAITLTQNILHLCISISKYLGYWEGINSPEPKPILRKENRIRTIQGTLAIEGNTLSQDQVTALIEGSRVIGSEREITEVKNAFSVYEKLEYWKVNNPKSMLSAHKILMKKLIDDPGKWRSGNVKIIKGEKVSHIAPPVDKVPGLMNDLFGYSKKNPSENLLKACVFHYEFLFIHPFSDGNGRIARLWQQLILMEYHSIFQYLSIESLVRDNQNGYYAALEKLDKSGESTVFVEFMLGLVLTELNNLVNSLSPRKLSYGDRIVRAKVVCKDKQFSRKDYPLVLPSISTATASRDLQKAVVEKLVNKTGEKALAKYCFCAAVTYT